MEALEGRGNVPVDSPVSSAFKYLQEAPHASINKWQDKYAKQINLTLNGLTPQQMRDFFAEMQAVSKQTEPKIESGNKYSVSSDFHKMNAELLMHQVTSSDRYRSLSQRDRARAMEFFSTVFLDNDLRNRNPLHPTMTDSSVVGTLLNFLKHIFGFPFAGYATDGNESLSLVLYSYRQLYEARDTSEGPALVLYVHADTEDVTTDAMDDLVLCAERLGMEFHIVSEDELARMGELVQRVAVVLTSFGNDRLKAVANWAKENERDCHLHVRDTEWRNVFANKAPVHFNLPEASPLSFPPCLPVW